MRVYAQLFWHGHQKPFHAMMFHDAAHAPAAGSRLLLTHTEPPSRYLVDSVVHCGVRDPGTADAAQCVEFWCSPEPRLPPHWSPSWVRVRLIIGVHKKLLCLDEWLPTVPTADQLFAGLVGFDHEFPPGEQDEPDSTWVVVWCPRLGFYTAESTYDWPADDPSLPEPWRELAKPWDACWNEGLA